ncbi:MAG: CDP-alcohol phosphatidyltransferase family protein [Salibacteraceae bacterium]
MKAIVRFIPNFLTLGNAALGVAGIMLIGREDMIGAVFCVALALVLDFLDGFVARLLNAQSELGGQLDSLADCITFGALPGLILFHMIAITQGLYFVDISFWSVSDWLNCGMAFLVPMAAVYRLATFNLDTRSRPHFLGLPTPAMCLVVLGIPLVLESNYHLNFYHFIPDSILQVLSEERRWDNSDLSIVKLLGNSMVYQLLSIFLAAAMVVRIPMISIKFNGIKWSTNKWRYALIIWALITYFIFLVPYLDLPLLEWGRIDYLALPIFMMGYFVLSWIYAIFEAVNSDTQTHEI